MDLQHLPVFKKESKQIVAGSKYSTVQYCLKIFSRSILFFEDMLWKFGEWMVQIIGICV